MLKISCYTTGMFPLPNPMSHVSSAAFAQARLRAGSASAQACSHLIHMLTRNYQLLTRGLKMPLIP